MHSYNGNLVLYEMSSNLEFKSYFFLVLVESVGKRLSHSVVRLSKLQVYGKGNHNARPSSLAVHKER